jgi:predicted metal-dependent phosphotriesterase family hydrolase
MPPVIGITILDEAGKPVPELREVLELVAAHDVILSTGHLSKREILVLLGEARSVGVKKVVVTHADIDTTDLTVDDQLEMAQMGAFIEHSFTPCMPMRQRLDPRMIAKAIQKVGANRCIMSSDFGQMHNPLPIEGMRMFVQHMLKCGISQEQIDIMTKYNPTKLLNLE